MSNELYKVFEDVEIKAKQLDKCWRNFYLEISHHLPESYQPEMTQLSEQMRQALGNIIDELRNPTLTIATTGTTSSGKSTLVNLLCGAELVPVAVSEMSAGVVTIEYSEQKSLIIKPTSGASWECGEWIDISEEEICQRLYGVMIEYIENREANPDVACPQSIITYPFRMLTEFGLVLPEGTRVRIMDFPGLAYVGDESNADVIRQCKEALCIVTYNSAETDQRKVSSLLQEVVDQVKELRGSPARMLFVLNKIDVFRSDSKWPETEERFVRNTVESIKQELTESLKEYTKDIEKLQVTKLSTLPALLSLQIMQSEMTLQEILDELPKSQEKWSAFDRQRVAKAEVAVSACVKADQQFTALVSEDIMNDLPRNQRRWSRHDQTRFSEALWQGAYSGEFQTTLKDHITQHFPQLVIPQMIDRFNITAGNAISEWAIQTTAAVLSSSEEEYRRECDEIERIRASLKRFLKTSDTKLREPFERINDNLRKSLEGTVEEDPIRYLENQIKGLENESPYDSLGDKLYPFYGWRRELGKAIQQILGTILDTLKNGKIDLNGALLKKADYRNVNLLESNLKRLIASGYTADVASEGCQITAKTDTEKNRLKQLNDELNELAIHLNMVMEDVLQQVCEQELGRMYEAVFELFSCHLFALESGAREISPNMNIKFPDSELIKIESRPEISFKFKAGFAVEKGTWMEKAETLQTGKGDHQTVITVGNAVRRNTKGKSGWGWLEGAVKGIVVDYAIKGQRNNERYIDYTQRSSDNANIPGAMELLEGWTIQARDGELEIVRQIADWLIHQIDSLRSNVDQVQTSVVNRYQERLDKAYGELTVNYEELKRTWEPIQKSAQELEREFSALSMPLRSESALDN
ncbi:MAG: dynamin family protein [Cyanobacteria bacterium J06650_10]